MIPSRSSLLLLLLQTCLGLSARAAFEPGTATPPPSPGRQAPAFDLPQWQTGQHVRLMDFSGQIVVLDFFAYWCVPCEVASKELETGVQQYYAARKGNPQGVPVRVISVNIEKDLPERTAEFLRRTGASFVVNDASAELLSAFGQAGIPFLVVVDGSAATALDPRFQVVYQHAGFAGVRHLRKIIDALGRAGDRPLSAVPEDAASLARGVPARHTLEGDTEWAWASDILLSDSQLRYEQVRGGTEWDAAFGYATYDMEYQPNRAVDFFGFKEDLNEHRYSLVGNLRQELGDSSPVTLLASASGRDGYPNYRRVWIANRYQQKYDHPDFPRVPPYTEPSPSEWTASLGARWEYLPTIAFAELKPGYAHEVAAPGYEDGTNSVGDYRLIRNRVNLDTASLEISSENILTRRVRAQSTLSFSKTTGREWRSSYRGAVNVAVGERWVLRGTGGYSAEDPQFEAYYFGLTAEYELCPNVLLSLAGRYYSDTGEIENSLSITSAAPPLESWELGLGLRYTYRRLSVKVYGGPFGTDYNRKPNIGPEFIYLYSDRKWGLAQLALSLQF